LPEVLPFAYGMAIIGLITLILFAVVEFMRARLPIFPKKVRSSADKPVSVASHLPREQDVFYQRWWRTLKYSIIPPKATNTETQPVSLLACIAPIIPIVLVLLFSFPILPAFLVGVVYAVATTAWHRTVKENSNLISAAVLDGIADSAAPVSLMIGIGMLIKTVMHPELIPIIQPALQAVIPTGAMGFVLFFIIFCPLALYRGPLTFMGLGGGVAKLLVVMAVFPATLITTVFVSIRQMTASTDPTNTQVVWTASFCKVRVTQLMVKLLPYTWAMSAAGIVLAAVCFL
ncbi:MAG: hypothetical protein QME64_00190, partial [bacterium]|nr:hypothetical protein [bacterium]